MTVRRRYDEHVHAKHAIGDPSKRAFTYFVLTGGRFIYASALRVAVLKFILSMTVRSSPSILYMLPHEASVGCWAQAPCSLHRGDPTWLAWHQSLSDTTLSLLDKIIPTLCPSPPACS